MKERTNCEVCGEILKPLFELPNLPLTEALVEKKDVKDYCVDQVFSVCDKCGHGQLLNMVDLNILYGDQYTFRTTKSMSSGSNDKFVEFIEKIIEEKKIKTIIEIGCNDMYLLKLLKNKVNTLIGIDPTLREKEKQFTFENVTAIGDFVENVDVKELIGSDETLIISSHFIEHLEHPRKLLEELFSVSSDKTYFAFAFPSFDVLIQEGRFDQIYSHHEQYFSFNSFNYMLNEIGGVRFDYGTYHKYWGTLFIAFQKSKEKHNQLYDAFSSKDVLNRYRNFQIRMKSLGEFLHNLDEDIIGYGAGLQLPVLCYHMNYWDFKYIIDDNVSKDGLFYLTLPVQIKSSGDIDGMNVFITAPTFGKQILKKLLKFDTKRVFVPLYL